MKPFVSLLVIFSIWTTLFAPFSLAQNSNSNSIFAVAKNKLEEPEKEKKGLQFRVREGKPEATPRTSPTPVSTAKLSNSETDSILKRLAPLPTEEKSEFKLRSDSLPPPKTGTIINTKFPADETKLPPNVSNSKTLEVIRYSPNGVVGVTPEISITFSQPMIAVTSQTEASENIPVKLTPAVKGKWRWLGTRVLIFDAEKRLPMATKFAATIPAGTKSAAGGTLQKDVIWKFTTPAPKIEHFEPRVGVAKRDEVMLAIFDQEINRDDVLSKIIVTSDGQKIPIRLATETEVKENQIISALLKVSEPKGWIAFRSKDLLPFDSKVEVNFDFGIPSSEGKLTTTQTKSFSFKTHGALKLEKSTCSWDESMKVCPPTANWRFEFNNPLDAKNFDKSQIKIEPKIENVSFNVYENQISLYSAKKTRTAYTVTISKDLKDEFGQSLGQDVSTKFTTGAQEPVFYSPGNNFVTLAPNAKPTHSIYSINYANLKAKIYSVNPEDYQAYLAFNESTGKYPTFGKLVFDQTIKIKNKPDEQVETQIDLSPALTKGLGHAVLIIEPLVKTKNSSRRIVKWIQATNMGVDAFGDREQLNVFTSNLLDGKPLSNIQISLTNGVSGVSGENGVANIKLLPRKPRQQIFLIAKNGEDSAILLRSSYSDFYDDYEDGGYYRNAGWFKVPIKDNLRWFVFDDRKMYRPGETVSIKGYLRKVTGGKMSDVSELADSVSGISYVLKDSRDAQITKGTAKLNAFGAFDLQLKIPENANLGEQSLELKAVSALGENQFTHNFQVQEFRRPEFEVNTNVESAAPFYLGDSATLVTEAKYFSGGGLANAEADWDISAMPTNYTPPNREDFTFGKFTRWWGYRYENNWELRSNEEFKGITDIEGKHRVALDFLKANPARPYTINAEANVQDVNRQTFTGKTTLLVHPSKLYVGLKTPKTFVQVNETFKVETITTDIDGKSAANAPVTVTAELKDWQQEKGEWKEVVVDTQKCQVKSTNEIVQCDFTAKQGGTYTITARVLDEKERPNESELTVWVAGGKRKESRGVERQTVELIPDKKEYAPNETAEILLNAPFSPAEGVMTLERNGIVKTERFSLNSSSTVLKIPIEEAYLPNIHVGITLVGASPLEVFGDERDKNLPKIPAYATADLNLEISTDSRKLKVNAEPVDKVLQPAGQTKVNIAVTDNNGKAVANSEVALVAVDESILALTGYKIDNPLDVFYEQNQAETNDAHSRQDVSLNNLLSNNETVKANLGFGNRQISGGVLNATNANAAAYSIRAAANAAANVSRDPFAKPMATPGPDGADFNVDGFSGGKLRSSNMARIDEPIVPNQIATKGNLAGGGGGGGNKEESPQMMQLRRNFAATAIFAPSVKTDANGKATVDLKLPDNLTRYRITAVAVTKSKQFGLGESNVTAKQPLMVRPSAPRFMNFGDKVDLPVVLQNQTDAPMRVEVAIRASNATLTDGNGKRVTVPANDRAEIRFPITAESAGIARFQIGASSQKFADAAEVEFPVYTPATTEAFATYGTTDQNGAIIQPVSAPKDVFPNFGGLEITSSSTQLQELTDAFIYLQSYPFECSEQISSRMLSVAALRDVLTAFNAKDMPSKAAIEAKMKSDIERLQKLQHKDGGFSFWREDDESFPFVTVHVAHAFARAKAKGYTVPKETINKLLIYLTTIESKYPKWYSREARWSLSAYSLFVRNLLGDTVAIPKARLLLLNAGLEKLSPEAIGWILSVLANDKSSTAQVETIKKHLLNRVTETADKAHFVTNYTDGEYVLLSSEKRADAIILEALLKVESRESRGESDGVDDLIPKIVRGLLANRTKGRWQSTQENTFVLLALDKYFQTYEKTTPNFIAKVWLGNAYAGEQKFVGRTSDSNLINVPMIYLQQQKGEQNLILDKQGAGRLYYRIGLKYAPKNLNLPSADYGFEVTRTYEAVDDSEDVRRNTDGSWTIKAGSRVRIKVQMVNQSNRYHVALVDYLPAGFETINPELANSSSTGDKTPNFWNWFEHQNLRDNRTEAFCALLNPGVWEYKYVVRATTLGNFVAPPAKAEEMYSPETFGRSGTDFVQVE